MSQNSVGDSGHETRNSSRVWWIALGLLAVFAVFAAAETLLLPKWHNYRENQFHDGCKTAVRKSEWKTLQAISAAWRTWDPESDVAILNCAEAAKQLGDAQSAADFLNDIHDSYRGALEALAIRGELLLGDLNLPFDAEENWNRMLRINRYATLPRQRLIYFYTMTLQRKKMMDLIREGITIKCEPPEAYAYLLLANNLNFTDGFTISTNWRQNSPDSEMLEVAQAIYAGRNKYDGDETIYEKSDVAPGDQNLIDACLKKYPHNLEVLSYHAEKKIYEGSTVDIVSLLKNAPEEASEDSRFWRYRGWLFKNQNLLEKAKIAYERSLELSPSNWQSRYELANILRLEGKIDEAAKHSEISILGKKIERELFESPDAQKISRQLVAEMIRYMDAIGETDAASAFRLRTGMTQGSVQYGEESASP